MIGIHLIFLFNFSVGLIPLNNITYFGTDLFLFGNGRVEGLVYIIFCQRFESLSPYKFISFDYDPEIRCNLKFSFINSNRIDFSFSEFFIQFNGDLIREDLDIILCRGLKIH
jgi:hypothetical protein